MENQALSWNLELFSTHETHLQIETLTQKGFVAFAPCGSLATDKHTKSFHFSFPVQTLYKRMLGRCLEKLGSVEIKVRK